MGHRRGFAPPMNRRDDLQPTCAQGNIREPMRCSRTHYDGPADLPWVSVRRVFRGGPLVAGFLAHDGVALLGCRIGGRRVGGKPSVVAGALCLSRKSGIGEIAMTARTCSRPGPLRVPMTIKLA